jgi:hypothetical protein
MIKRLIFGAICGLLIAYPALLSIGIAIVGALVSQPAVLAFAAGVILWPRLACRVRRWAR